MSQQQPESGPPAREEEPTRTAEPATEPDTTPAVSDSSAPTEVAGQKERVTLRSRTGGLWVVLVAAAVVLVMLLVFVLQNQQRVRISFLAAEGSLPLGVALLFAAIAGVLIVAIPGTGRILQLRRAARRHQP